MPANYAALLLPVIPALGWLSRLASEASAIEAVLARLGWVVALALAGVAIALGLPSVMEKLGHQRRKEAELLAAPWLASLLVVQVPMLLVEHDLMAPLVVFVATCALLGAIPFGIEFQHRTLASLLTQPTDRRRIAWDKFQILGAASGIHALLFMTSWLAILGPTRDVGWLFAGMVVGIAVAMATPWWTLVARGILAGLVFSSLIPLAVAAVWGAADARWHSLGSSTQDLYLGLKGLMSVLPWFLAMVLTPLYGLFGAWGALRRWGRLEACDQGGSDQDGVFAQGLPLSWLRLVAPRSVLWHLLTKELRLQTVTAAALGLSILSAWLAVELTSRTSVAYLKEYLNGLVMLLGVTTVMLAGATAIAEERRLGTLDAQLLQPATRRCQWWLKVGMSLMLAAPAVWLFTVAAAQGPFVDRPTTTIVVLAAAWALTLSFLASSGSATTLSALNLSMVLSAIALVVLTLQFSIGPRIARVSTMHISLGDADTTIAHANALGSAAIEAMRDRLARGSSWVGVVGWLLVLLPFVPPWYLSWRNFASPMQALRRLRLQAFICLTLLLVCVIGTLALTTSAMVARERDHWLVTAWDTARFREQLSKAEDGLWRSPIMGSIPMGVRGVTLPMWTPVSSSNDLVQADGTPSPAPTQHHWVPITFSLPLSAADRELIVRRARIPDGIREALRVEAQLPPLSSSELPPRPSPSVVPPRSSQEILMDPAMAKRYGLVFPQGGAPGRGLPHATNSDSTGRQP